MAADFPQVSFRGCTLCPLVPAFWAQFAWVSRLVSPSGCIQVRSRSAVVAGRFVLEHLSGLLPREPPVDLRPALVGRRFQAWSPAATFPDPESGGYPDIDASTG